MIFKMKIKLKVHANSSRDKLTRINDSNYELWIKEKPIEGKANSYIEKFLKKELGVHVKIVSGFSSKIKTLDIKD